MICLDAELLLYWTQRYDKNGGFQLFYVTCFSLLVQNIWEHKFLTPTPKSMRPKFYSFTSYIECCSVSIWIDRCTLACVGQTPKRKKGSKHTVWSYFSCFLPNVFMFTLGFNTLPLFPFRSTPCPSKTLRMSLCSSSWLRGVVRSSWFRHRHLMRSALGSKRFGTFSTSSRTS